MIKKRIFIILTILLMLITSIITLGNSYSISQAGPVCGSMGSFMSPTSVYTLGIINRDEPNRKWTVEETFKGSIYFTSYYGEGEGDWIYANKVDRGKDRAQLKGYDWSDAEVQDNLKAARGLSCVVGKGDFIPNFSLGLASGISGMIGTFISFLLGEDFMVKRLVEIIGGTNGNSGLITIFFQSIYMPLVVIAFLFTAGTIIYKGLIKMQLREALSSIIWSTMAFVIGVTLMFNPGFLVGIPQAATSTITTCVLGALNGQNCLTGQVTTPTLLTGTECISSIEGDINSADMMVNGMSCTIWKTFVLEPWAEEQFGIPYSQLYTDNAPEGGSIWNGLEASGADGKDYCVNLASTGSAKDFNYGKVKMDKNDNSTVCNIALYQLYLMTNIEDPVNHSGDGYKLTSNSGSDKEYDERWYDIIVPMAKHNTGWNNWTGQNRLIIRIGSTLMSIFGVFAASIVLITLAVFAAAYKVTGVIMMAFAPLFLLFAVEPNRGKKIFLGWLETLISSILKYFAITILVIVSLVLYSGILSTTSNIASFVSVIILTVVLLSYRSEVVNLIGASNMGGQKLTNKANKALDWTKKQGKQKGSALVGGAIGGSIAGRNSHLKDIEERRGIIGDMQESLKLATAENRKDDVEIIKRAIEEEEKIVNNLDTKDAKKEAIKSGRSEGAKGAGERIMRRGVSLTASAFRQKTMTENDLDRSYSDKRGRDIHNDPEVANAMSGKNKGNSDGGSGGNQENNYNMSDLDLSKSNLESQRDNLEYTGDLTEEEKVALDKFADDLANQDDDSKLANMANNPDIMQDENKKMVVANEINARLRFNTLKGEVGNPDITMNPISNPSNMSNLDLMMGINLAKENYKETGDINEFNRFNQLGQEEIDRGIGKQENFDIEKQNLEEHRENIANGKLEYTKDDSQKTKAELSEMYNNNKEEYDKYVKDSYVVPNEAEGHAVISQELINREKKVGDNRETVEKNNKKTDNNSKLPDLDPKDPNDDGPGGSSPNVNKDNFADKDEMFNINKNQASKEQSQPENKQQGVPKQNQPENKQQETPKQSQPGNKRQGVPKQNQPENKRQETPKQSQPENKQQETPKQSQPENKQQETPKQSQPENKQQETPKQNQPENKQQETQNEQNNRKEEIKEETRRNDIDKAAQQHAPEEFSWEDTFGSEDISKESIENLNDKASEENEIDDFYNNLDDFMK